jgi:polar amino acid transport system ATP-binding protein
MSFLVLRDVTKTFGTNPVLRGINLEVDLHQVVCLIGASGSGKSTMLRCINQLETVDSGEIHLGGDRVSGRGIDVDALRREVGIVFQAFNLFPHMTVLENVTLAPVKVLGFSKALAEERGVALLKRIGLDDKAKEYPDRLSGGQQQRVAIVRALAMEPRLLLLDEPMAGMNLEEKEDMSRFIIDVNNIFGTTIALIEHDMGVVMDLSDRVIVLDYGRKIADGTPDQVKADQNVIDAYLGVAH